jgi:hypothetical protein
MHTRIPSKARPSAHLLLLAAVAAAAGCTGNIGGGGLSGAGGAGGGEPLTPAAQFAALEPELRMNCEGCHIAGDAAFLVEPAYTSVLSWPDLVLKDWQNSLFLTYAVGNTPHPGTQLDSEPLAETLLPKIRTWLEAEAQYLPVPNPGVPTVGPFIPNLKGFNAVYFKDLGEEYAGIAITFNGSLTAEGYVQMDGIEINPTKDTGVHMVHPLFSVFEPGSSIGVAEPDDTYAAVDATYVPNQTGPLVPQTAVIKNWITDARLAITFDLIEIATGMGGVTCNDVASFSTNVQGQLAASCVDCHAGGNATATAAVDMSNLDTDPASACARIKNRVNLLDPALSQIFVNTDPGGGSTHPFKFNGDVTAFTAFRDAALIWITAEQMAMP